MSEHLDVLIVGAGLSGIAAAHHLATRCPAKTFAILEARGATGGTWDLFRYPGVRSDSDMYTLGYSFRPWPDARAIADGPSILSYIRDTATAGDLDTKIRLRHRVVAASWSSADARWTVTVSKDDDAPVAMTCGFLFVCAGYYDYDAGYMPDFPGVERFRGRLVHPQAWPEDLAVGGRRIVVIGSGATAVTLVPALAQRGAEVTMLQRSPSYVVARPAVDRFAARLRRRLPNGLAYRIVRWRNILVSIALYAYARRKPVDTKRRILDLARRALGPTFDVERHFAPRYAPWDQRVCLVPDADLFKALRGGGASIVTDEIETFEEEGVRLRSGQRLGADIVVAATGLKLKLLGGIPLEVDGRRVDLSQAMSYRGSMFSGVPNLAYALGYTNASWTLKCDLTSLYVCRLLRYMDRKGYSACMPRRDPAVEAKPLIGFTSGYVQRADAELPKQGGRQPWRLNQNYLLDLVSLKYGRLDEGALVFTRPERPAPAGASSAVRA